MRLLFLILFAVNLFSCDVQRDIHKSDVLTNTNEITERITKRAGDTVTYQTQLHIKDTTVYIVNRYGTTLKTVYDRQGHISNVDCYASALETIERMQRSLLLKESTKNKQEHYLFDDTFILYIAGTIVTIVCLGFVLLYLLMRKNATDIAQKIRR